MSLQRFPDNVTTASPIFSWCWLLNFSSQTSWTALQMISTTQRICYLCFRLYRLLGYISTFTELLHANVKQPLREKCQNTEFFLVRIFLYSEGNYDICYDFSMISFQIYDIWYHFSRSLTVFWNWTSTYWCKVSCVKILKFVDLIGCHYLFQILQTLPLWAILKMWKKTDFSKNLFGVFA